METVNINKDALDLIVRRATKAEELLSCRAGKLLKKGKPFIVIANDESYFTSVYLVIREAEKAKGTWTEKCEEYFQELTNYGDLSTFPSNTPELQTVMQEYREKRRLEVKVKLMANHLRSLALDLEN